MGEEVGEYGAMGRENEFFLNFYGEQLNMKIEKYIIVADYMDVEGEANELYFL